VWCGVRTLVTSEDSEDEYSERADGRREPLPPRPPAAPPPGAAAVAAGAAWPELSSSKLRPTGERGRDRGHSGGSATRGEHINNQGSTGPYEYEYLELLSSSFASSAAPSPSPSGPAVPPSGPDPAPGPCTEGPGDVAMTCRTGWRWLWRAPPTATAPVSNTPPSSFIDGRRRGWHGTPRRARGRQDVMQAHVRGIATVKSEGRQ
jgi:hypothetical protein